MVHDGPGWRMKALHTRLALAVAAFAFGGIAGSTVQAASVMRTPNLNLAPRVPSISPSVPSISPTVVPRIDPNIAGRAASRIGGSSSSLRTRPTCGAAYRDSDGGCSAGPVASANGGGSKAPPGKGKAKSKADGPRRTVSKAATPSNPTNAKEIVAEIDGALSDAQADALARRHGLRRLQSQNFPLIGSTIGLFRITDRRSVETASRQLAAEAGVGAVQPNFRYVLQDQVAAKAEGDPAQYALGKLRLPEAHTLAHGANVTLAVIDSGIDAKHPELAGAIAASFDALGSKEGPHAHGTGIAGAIVSHARLMGSAPAAQILAIRAFGAAANGAESTSFVILKSLDYAVGHGAQIINMSFAGPKDALIERAIAAVAAKGIVMVAAAGNAGPKSAPLYPAANPDVIAVSATDAQDKLFSASNRGGYVAMAAPGVDIFLPAPDQKYQMTSGTSLSAAYVSGLAALVLERNPALKPDALRTILIDTARDLGTPGRDDLYGAGQPDAFAAVSAAAASSVPPTVASDLPASEKIINYQNVSEPSAVPTRIAPDAPEATPASDKPPAAR
jgi:subtilisin family serine protease